VAVQVFRRRVQHEVCTESERSLPAWRQESVIDEHQRARLVCGARHRGDIHYPQQWIARRLHPHELWLFGQRSCQGFTVRLIDERHARATTRQRREEPIGAAVTIMGHDQEILRLEQVCHQGDRRHTRSRDHATGTALERRNRLGQRIPSRVPGAGVVVAAFLAETAEGICRRQMDGRNDGSVLCVRLESRAHCSCGTRQRLAHLAPPVLPNTSAKIARSAASSFKNASCPYREELSNSRAGPASRSRNVRMSSRGTSWSSFTATSVTGTLMRSGWTRCRSMDSDKQRNASGQ